MRAIHLGDLHLCRGPKNVDRMAALDYAINHASEQPIDVWLWPGDLTDAGTTIEIRNYLIGAVQQMTEFAPVVIVRGNHDPEGDLLFLRAMETKFPVYVVEREPEVLMVELPEQRRHAAIACIPYPSKAAIVAAGTPNDQINAVVDAAFETIFMGLGAELQKARDHGQPTLALGHVTIAGAVASTGQPQIGTELEITEAHLKRLGDCLILLNHIHRHQRVGSTWYAGSLCRMDWGETEPKGYIEVIMRKVVEGARNAPGDVLWGHSIQFVPVPVPPMYHVDGTLTRDRFDWIVTKGPDGPKDEPPRQRGPATDDADRQQLLFHAEAAGIELEPIDWTGCDVRVRVHYAQAERAVLNNLDVMVRGLFHGARRLEIEPIAVPDRALRAPEVVQAHTLRDKLQAWAKLSEVGWSDRIEAFTNVLLGDEDADRVVASAEQVLRTIVWGR